MFLWVLDALLSEIELVARKAPLGGVIRETQKPIPRLPVYRLLNACFRGHDDWSFCRRDYRRKIHFKMARIAALYHIETGIRHDSTDHRPAVLPSRKESTLACQESKHFRNFCRRNTCVSWLVPRSMREARSISLIIMFNCMSMRGMKPSPR